MEWQKFQQFIRRNTTPTALVRFYPPNKTYPNKMTICDYNLPRRKGFLSHKGWRQEEWFHQTQLCVATYLRGEIPLKGWAADPENEDPDRQIDCRGAISVILSLIDDGVLELTSEVYLFLRRHGNGREADKRREVSHRNCAGMYIRPEGDIAASCAS